jgi:hypothetical protein
MLPKEQIAEIFKQYPEAKELFQDCHGQVWTERTPAEFQSAKNGGKITILKRKDFINSKE